MADLTGMMQAVAGNAGNPNAWDISKAYYDAGADAWDISKAFYSNDNKSVAAQDTAPQGLFFKPDGTKMYICGDAGNDINEYSLSTPWLVSSATYVQVFSVAGQDATPLDLFFKPDGTKMYVLGGAGDDVNEYDLSSAWDISTASYVQNFSVATQDTNPYGLFFKTDGTKMYVTGPTTDAVNEYDLSTPWDISTASHVQTVSVNTNQQAPRGLFFRSDGLKMYLCGTSNQAVDEYNLSSAWDISTLSYVQSFSVISQEGTPEGVFFHPDGSSFYVVGTGSDAVLQYIIGSFSVASEELIPRDIFFKTDGTKLYIIGVSGDEVNEYDLSTAWDIRTASYLQNFSVASQTTAPIGVSFKPDGTEMYVLEDSTSDEIHEYSLSSAWDISTASFVSTYVFSVSGTAPDAFYVAPDGLNLYILSSDVDDGYLKRFTMSSAWDFSTRSASTSLSVLSTLGSSLEGIFFKPDGTKGYVIRSSGDDQIIEFSLSTPWDITTISVTTNFLVFGVTPTDLFWKDDGTQFWTIDSNFDRILSYSISPT
jgi:DNA-binding beta-propeller fold protein YncE